MRGAVVLTASAGSFPGLIEQLRALSIAVEERPLIRFAPPADWASFDAALDAVAGDSRAASPGRRYTAIALTSPRAARAFMERLEARDASARAITSHGIEIWAAGAGTARALADGAGRARVPAEADVGRLGAAAALARAMLEAGVRGTVLFPCGDHRRDELPARLRDGGIEVDDVVCYRSVLASESEARAAAERAAVIVVGSPSVAALLARACGTDARPMLVAVGPTTAEASRASGWPPAAVATHPTAEAVGAAVRTLLL